MRLIEIRRRRQQRAATVRRVSRAQCTAAITPPECATRMIGPSIPGRGFLDCLDARAAIEVVAPHRRDRPHPRQARGQQRLPMLRTWSRNPGTIRTVASRAALLLGGLLKARTWSCGSARSRSSPASLRCCCRTCRSCRIFLRFLAAGDLAAELARDAHELLDLLARCSSCCLRSWRPQVVLDAAADVQAHGDRHHVDRQHVAASSSPASAWRRPALRAGSWRGCRCSAHPCRRRSRPSSSPAGPCRRRGGSCARRSRSC